MINRMRTIVFFSILVGMCVTHSLKGENPYLSSEIRLADGRIVDSDYIFTIPDNPTFTKLSGTDCWRISFSIYSSSNSYREPRNKLVKVMERICPSGEYEFTITTSDTKTIPWYRTYRKKDENGMTIEYYSDGILTPEGNTLTKGCIKFEDRSGKTLYEVDLLFNLRPGKPLLENVSYEYSIREITDNNLYLWGDWNLKIKSERAASAVVCYSAPGYCFSYPGFEKLMARCTIDNLNETGFTPFLIDGINWGTYMIGMTCNDYGWARAKSNVICSTDYITDPYILDKINELRENAGIEGVNLNANWSVTRDGDAFSVTAGMLAGARAEIYDAWGRRNSCAIDGDRIDISGLDPGVYLLCITTRDNRRKTIKFIK